jgi:hypothetical protein
MKDTDRPAFVSAFRRLAVTFRMKLRPADMDSMIDMYLQAFEPYALHDVVAAANASLHTHRRFPKPLDWIEAITRTQVGAPPDVRVMSTVEASDYVRAERLHYDDDPCDCLTCQADDTTTLRRRFVPDFTDDDREERAYCPLKNRIVVVGHWAHGHELQRWYAARQIFFGDANRSGVHAKVLRRLGFIYTPPASAPRLQLAEREPGEEG